MALNSMMKSLNLAARKRRGVREASEQRMKAKKVRK